MMNNQESESKHYVGAFHFIFFRVNFMFYYQICRDNVFSTKCFVRILVTYLISDVGELDSFSVVILFGDSMQRLVAGASALYVRLPPSPSHPPHAGPDEGFSQENSKN